MYFSYCDTMQKSLKLRYQVVLILKCLHIVYKKLGNGHVVTSKLNLRPFMGVGERVGVTPLPPSLKIYRESDLYRDNKRINIWKIKDIDSQDKIIIGTY